MIFFVHFWLVLGWVYFLKRKFRNWLEDCEYSGFDVAPDIIKGLKKQERLDGFIKPFAEKCKKSGASVALYLDERTKLDFENLPFMPDNGCFSI